MKIQVSSENRYILDSIVGILRERNEKHLEGFDSTLDFAIEELTKNHLRRFAQYGDDFFLDHTDSITHAIESVCDDIRERVPDFVLGKKFRKKLNELSYPASEIRSLAQELIRSRNVDRIGKRISVSSNNNVCEIIEIGLAGNIEGFLASPMRDQCSIDLDNLQKMGFELQGDWFPYEIVQDELCFILDDDGTVYISTENFPESLLGEAKEYLKKIVSFLYQ